VSVERTFSDRDDEGEDLGGFSGGIPYDEDEDEDGGWAINKDHSDSLWDSAEESDEDDEEATELVDAGDTEEEDSDVFGGGLTAPRRRGRRPASERPGAAGSATPLAADGGGVGGDTAKGKSAAKPMSKSASPKQVKPAKGLVGASKKAPAQRKKPAKATKKAVTPATRSKTKATNNRMGRSGKKKARPKK
jgi:hypothetical protein